MQKKSIKKMKKGGVMNNLRVYISSIFQNFGSYLRIENDLVEYDIRLILDECSSNFITYEIPPGNHTFKDLSKALFNNLQPEYEIFNNPVDIEIDDINMKTELVVKLCILAIRFDAKSFFSTIPGFSPYWDFKHYNEHISQKIVNISSINKKHFKADVIDGSAVNC